LGLLLDATWKLAHLPLAISYGFGDNKNSVIYSIKTASSRILCKPRIRVKEKITEQRNKTKKKVVQFPSEILTIPDTT